ncbi:MAG: beta-lactamase family protein [Sandaracinaceae bacterium]|nr:beta-lactamase family protein [Sandaracinaceae bacterium]
MSPRLRRSHHPRSLLVLLTLLCAACSESGEGGRCDGTYELPDTFDPTLAGALQAMVTDRLPSSSAPGATLTVHIPGEGTFAGAAGFRDVLGELPMEPRTRLRVGSVTKTFTTAVFFQLVAEGAVSLDDHPAEVLAALGLSLDPTVTFAQVLGHRAGLFNYTDDVGFLGLSRDPWTPVEIVSWSLDHGAVGDPGAQYLYSNTGFFVLGLAIEELSGRPFHREVRRRLLDPLALDDMSEEQHEGRDCAMSEGYVVTGAASTDDIDMSWTWAAGGLVGSGVDLCRWLDALYLGDVLGADARAQLVVASAESISAGDAYGYGTQLRTRGGRPVVGHTGSTMGFRGEVFIDLESGVCVAVLLNDFVSTPTAISEPAWVAAFDYLGLSAP